MTATALASAPTDSRFSCPSCRAPVEFDPATGGLKCPFCSAAQILPRGPVPIHPLTEMAALAIPRIEGTKTLRCRACGAEATLSSATAATLCAFCGGTIEPVAGSAAPPAEAVLPFKVAKSTAAVEFAKWIKGLWFRPSSLQKLARLSTTRGVYLPIWAFDCDAWSNWTAEAGFTYYETRIVEENGQTKEVKEAQVRWEPASGSHSGHYEGIVVPASKGLPLKELHRIEPFQLEEATTFDGGYLAGLEAESHSIAVMESWRTGQQRVQNDERTACDRMVPGDQHRNLNVATSTSNEQARSLLLPVYLGTYEYQGKVYRIAMNGQTAKMAGDAPWSIPKIAGLVASILAVAGALYYYFAVLKH